MKTQFLARERNFVAYDDIGGAGTPVICVPGLGDLRQEYRYLGPILQYAGYRVITMDLRGHGESGVDWSDYSPEAVGSDILALIEHLNLKKAIIVGTSFAAASAVWAAGVAPDLILGLVLCGPFIRDVPLIFVQRVMMQVLFSGPWKVAAWVAYYASLYPSKKPTDFEQYQRKLKINLSEPGRFNALSAMMFGKKAACEQQASNVQAPSLTIMGTKDPDFQEPETEAKFVARQLTGKYIMIEGVGHYPHVEQAENVGSQVLKFIHKITQTNKV